MLTQKRLMEILSYNQETGVFTWKVQKSNNVKVGSCAGSENNEKYLSIKIDRKTYKCHRLAWLYVYGEWPSFDLDHVNGNRSDNRLVNLRVATRRQNSHNTKLRADNRSGRKGVSWHNGRWVARITIDGKTLQVGRFKCVDEAHAAYCAASEVNFGEFAKGK